MEEGSIFNHKISILDFTLQVLDQDTIQYTLETEKEINRGNLYKDVINEELQFGLAEPGFFKSLFKASTTYGWRPSEGAKIIKFPEKEVNQ